MTNGNRPPIGRFFHARVGLADDENGADVLDRPGRREAAIGCAHLNQPSSRVLPDRDRVGPGQQLAALADKIFCYITVAGDSADNLAFSSAIS